MQRKQSLTCKRPHKRISEGITFSCHGTNSGYYVVLCDTGALIQIVLLTNGLSRGMVHNKAWSHLHQGHGQTSGMDVARFEGQAPNLHVRLYC